MSKDKDKEKPKDDLMYRLNCPVCGKQIQFRLSEAQVVPGGKKAGDSLRVWCKHCHEEVWTAK